MAFTVEFRSEIGLEIGVGVGFCDTCLHRGRAEFRDGVLIYALVVVGIVPCCWACYSVDQGFTLMDFKVEEVRIIVWCRARVWIGVRFRVRPS